MEHWLLPRLLGSFVGFYDGLVGILTLGLYRPGWPFKFAAWWVRREIRLQEETKETS